MLRLDPIGADTSAPGGQNQEPSSLVEELKPFLDGIKRRVMASFPADAMATILDATEKLVRSGIAQRAIPEGERAPGFELLDTKGEAVALQTLLSRGPVVIAFFRGFW